MVGERYVRGLAAALGTVVVLAWSAGPAAGERRHPGPEVVVLSQDVNGRASNGRSIQPAISADGRYVAFESSANDLVPGEPLHPSGGVFVRDTLTGVITRASVPDGGGIADAVSGGASISADGRYVAFYSFATNLVPGAPPDALPNIYVRDMVRGKTRVVSVDGTGGWPDGSSLHPAISGDGRYVAFQSDATDIVPDDGNGATDVFVRNLVRGTTTRVSVDRDGGDADGSSTDPSLSFDGQTSAFVSDAQDLLAVDGPGLASVYARSGGTTVLVSAPYAGHSPDDSSSAPSVSADASAVAFASRATNLVPGDGNGFTDVFVRDLGGGPVVRVSVARGGGDADHASFAPSISADGGRVAFESVASNLVRRDRGGVIDVFVHDRVVGATVRWSVDTDGGSPNQNSTSAALAANADRVAFQSTATDLVDRHTFQGADVFLARLNA